MRVTLAFLFFVAAPLYAQDWPATVTPYAPGSFPELKPLRVQYGFGWGSLMAATAEVHITRADGRYHFEGNATTTGPARALWKFDGKQDAITDARTLLPIHVHETEAVRSKVSETEVNFTASGVTSRREERHGSNVKSKTREFEFPHVMSMSSALFYLRSLPLTEGTTQRIVVYPATTAYLCTVNVRGHEHLTVPAGSYDAIKLDLQLSKIDKDRGLKPHKKFRHATVWLSNDSDRLVLRIEAQIFIGTIFAELQSVQFDNAKP